MGMDNMDVVGCYEGKVMGIYLLGFLEVRSDFGSC